VSTRRTAEEICPDPGKLVESLRDFGYTLPTALADLVDNSLTAGAKNIAITIDSGLGQTRPHIAVVDDGCGMDKKTLVNAMRMGSLGPLENRAENDLGRFGLGLKTASLSQGRTVSVVTRTPGSRTPLVRCWNIEHIRKAGWQLIDELTQAAHIHHNDIKDRVSGTAVIIEDLDRPAFLRTQAHTAQDHLASVLSQVREHLEMVFHRFIEEGVTIYLGSTKLVPWDPFLRGKSQELPAERLRFLGAALDIQPFVLPHHSRLTDEDHARASGPLGWNAQQGFYIYRCMRLIASGTWLNLPFRKEEHYKLARIRVDLPNNVDSDWHLNVMKSHIAVPSVLRDDFRRIADTTRRQAVEVYRFRGERALPTGAHSLHTIWKREEARSGVRYRVDRTHPLMRALLHCGCEHNDLLEQVIEIVERTVPIAHMLQDPAKALDGSVETGPSSLPIEKIVALAVHVEQFLIRSGKKPREARQIVLASDPFCWHREAILNEKKAWKDSEGHQQEGRL